VVLTLAVAFSLGVVLAAVAESYTAFRVLPPPPTVVIRKAPAAARGNAASRAGSQNRNRRSRGSVNASRAVLPGGAESARFATAAAMDLYRAVALCSLAPLGICALTGLLWTTRRRPATHARKMRYITVVLVFTGATAGAVAGMAAIENYQRGAVRQARGTPESRPATRDRESGR
jgi:hypothetical protein